MVSFEVIPLHSFDIDERLKSVDSFKIHQEDKKDIKSFVKDASLGKVHKGKALLPATLVKYLFTLRVSLEFFKKPSSSLTLADVESFEKALSSDKLLSKSKKPFTASSKANIKTDLKVYLKWKLGDKSLPLVSWLDCRKPHKTPDYLSEDDIVKLYRACKNPSERFLIAILFDSGARAEEFHNIRFEDIQEPSGGEIFYKLTLKEEYSKTKGRVVSLYWKYSSEAIKDYLQERKLQGVLSSDPIFLQKYDNARQVLNRLGHKVLGRSIHYHLFRHSSATFYATKLNRQELCYRYGWTFSSDMPDVYINRAGMQSKQLDDKFKSTTLEQLERSFNQKIESLTFELERTKNLLQTQNSNIRKRLIADI